MKIEILNLIVIKNNTYKEIQDKLHVSQINISRQYSLYNKNPNYIDILDNKLEEMERCYKFVKELVSI